MYICHALRGEKLRELLQKHGSFKEVELHVAKYVRDLKKEGKHGKWVTKAYLTDILKYSKPFVYNLIDFCRSFIQGRCISLKPRTMVENSFQWAAARGLTRVNEVHKCEEARLILEETFSNEHESGSSRELRGDAAIEDCSWYPHTGPWVVSGDLITPQQNHRTTR